VAFHPEYSIRRRRQSFVGDTKHEPINGLPARRRQAWRDATRRPVSRKPQTNRKLPCHTAARQENLFLTGSVSTQADCGSVRLTRSAEFVQLGKEKVTFYRATLNLKWQNYIFSYYHIYGKIFGKYGKIFILIFCIKLFLRLIFRRSRYVARDSSLANRPRGSGDA